MTETPGNTGQIPDPTTPNPGASVSLDKSPESPGESVAPDPDGGNLFADAGMVDEDDEYPDPAIRDWAWVEEWREGGEPVPWGPGLALAAFALFLVASAVYVLSSGLSDHPILAIGINIIVAGGLGPALWLSRGLPVLRWISGGAAVGVVVGWVAVLIFLT